MAAAKAESRPLRSRGARLFGVASALLLAILWYLLPASVLHAQQTSVAGRVTRVWGDPPQGPPIQRWYLTEDAGRTYEIDVDRFPAFQLRGLDGRRAVVTGEIELRARPGATPMLAASSLGYLDAAPAAPIGAPLTGSQPWVTLLCRFADVADTPNAVLFYEDILGSDFGELNDYWLTLSYDAIDIVGSAVFGWYDLPKEHSSYEIGEEAFDLFAVAEDCVAAADADVFFPNFVGINLIVNDDLGCCAYGGRLELEVDGQTTLYRMTWMPNGDGGQAVLAHEMGHGFGLPHSSGPYGQVYDSNWDVMSGLGLCRATHPDYGCIAVQTISLHKYLLGWIPESRIFEPPNGTTTQLLLQPLSQAATTGYSMVRVPIDGTEYYTIEARSFDGYDVSVPAEGLVLHRTIGEGFAARVVDWDENGNVNDEGAVWVPGEVFADDQRRFLLTVDGSSPDGYTATIYYDTELPQRTLDVIVGGGGRGTVVSDPPGIDCRSVDDPAGAGECRRTFTLGSAVSFTATPNDTEDFHYFLSSWSGACNHRSRTCRIQVTEDRSLEVVFEVIPPSISFAADPTLRFVGMAGLPDPEPATVEIVNGGGSPLTDLAVGPIETFNAPQWVEAVLDHAEAPAVLTVRPHIASLAPNGYAARVRVVSEAAGNSPRTVNVFLTVLHALTEEDLIRALVGDRPLPAIAVEHLDSQANRNGFFDLGDFLRWFDDEGAGTAKSASADEAVAEGAP